MEQARQNIGDIYQTKRASDGGKQEMIRAVWSFTYVCPSCESEMIYCNHLDEKGKAPSNYPNKKCNEKFVKRLWERGEDVPVRYCG